MSRKYGGTGLGLSISRDRAPARRRRSRSESHLGSGSRFTLMLPLNERLLESAPAGTWGRRARKPRSRRTAGLPPRRRAPLVSVDEAGRLEPRRSRHSRDRSRRRARPREVVEARYACVARKSIVARRPTAWRWAWRREHRPGAILLGGSWARVEPALGQLKKHPDTRHLPVVVISDSAARITALRGGAARVHRRARRHSGGTRNGARATRAADPRLPPADRRDHRPGGPRRSAPGIGWPVARASSSSRSRQVCALAALHAEPFDLALVVVGADPAAQFPFLQELATDEVAREPVDRVRRDRAAEARARPSRRAGKVVRDHGR